MNYGGASSRACRAVASGRRLEPETEYKQAVSDIVEIPGHGPVVARYVTIPTLIAMKQTVGRPQDLDDIQHLR